MDGVKSIILILIILALSGCGNVMDDLNPSNADKRPAVQPGTTGPSVGQNAPDFTLFDTLGNSITLSSILSSPTSSGVVLYFTMWCPVCDSEMSDIQNSFIPNFPNITFFAVDYVSNSFSAARNEEIANGFGGSGFTVLADTSQTVLTLYQATMGTTVVIDKSGVIRMNEVYKPAKLQTILGGLP
jgi:peroxiredoxin